VNILYINAEFENDGIIKFEGDNNEISFKEIIESWKNHQNTMKFASNNKFLFIILDSPNSI